MVHLLHLKVLFSIDSFIFFMFKMIITSSNFIIVDIMHYKIIIIKVIKALNYYYYVFLLIKQSFIM